MVLVLVVVAVVVRPHLLDAGGNAPDRLEVRLRGRPAPRPLPSAVPSARGSPPLPCLSPKVYVALPPLALGSLPSFLAFVFLATSWAPSSVTCALARTATARILPVPMLITLAAPPFADRTLLRSMYSVAARLGALLAFLLVLPVPLLFPCSVPRVVPPPARALPPSAAAGLGALPTPSPSLPAACTQAFRLRLPSGTPPVASCPSLRAPVTGTPQRLRAVTPLLHHPPGVLLPLQLRQRDA